MADKPWIFRTYAGHSTARDSNALYRKNLAKGQTGLSVAFDLPTQTGYDSDHPLAKGEVGKVGVPISHLGDMRALFDGIPLADMNTSMTINATAAWLLALYVAAADEQGVARESLQGTTQNDIIKEYLSRGTYVFPPAPSMRLTKDTIVFTTVEMPKWNPMNVCSYHLQEAGATPVQELAFALATAIAVLDTREGLGRGRAGRFGEVVGRISFFVNAGLRFVTELCKMRAFAELWDEITAERYGVADPKHRLFRYGVQVNLAGPDRAAAGEQRRPHPDRDAGGDAVEEERARARRAAAGLERGARPAAAVGPAMVAAHAADPRLRDRPARIRRHLRRLARDRRQGRRAQARGAGGARPHRPDGRRGRGGRVELHEAAAGRVELERLEAIERGEQIVVGVNRYRRDRAVAARHRRGVDPHGVAGRRGRAGSSGLRHGAPRATPGGGGGARRHPGGGAQRAEPDAGLDRGGARRRHHRRMGPGVARGVRRVPRADRRRPRGARNDGGGLDDLRADVERVSRKLGRRMKFLVGKPGLDGHSNGAEQIAVRARDAGMEVVYEGIRLTPAEIVNAALEEGVHVVGLSILSGSHVPLVKRRGRAHARGRARRRAGGGRRHHPARGRAGSCKAGVAAVYTPKDFELNRIMADIVRIVDAGASRAAQATPQVGREELGNGRARRSKPEKSSFFWRAGKHPPQVTFFRRCQKKWGEIGAKRSDT